VYVYIVCVGYMNLCTCVVSTHVRVRTGALEKIREYDSMVLWLADHKVGDEGGKVLAEALKMVTSVQHLNLKCEWRGGGGRGGGMDKVSRRW